MGRAQHALLVVALTTMLALLGAARAEADAAFPPATQIPGACAGASPLQIVMNAGGDEVAVWVCAGDDGRYAPLQAATLPAGAGTWSPATDIGTTNCPGCTRAGIDDAGEGVVVWQSLVPEGTYTEIDAAVVDRAGTLIRRTTLSPSGMSSQYPRLGLNGAGDVVVAWYGWDGARTAPVAVTGTLRDEFGAAAPLEAYSGDRLQDQLAVAVNPRGDAAVAWARLGRPLAATVRAVGSSAFGPPEIIPGDGNVAGNPMVSVSARGQVTLVWESIPGQSSGDDWQIKVVQKPLDGTFGPAQVAASGVTFICCITDLVTNPAGDALIAFAAQQRTVEPGHLQVGAVTIPADGPAQPWFVVGEMGQWGSNTSATVDATGVATVSWSVLDGDGNATSYASSFAIAPAPAAASAAARPARSSRAAQPRAAATAPAMSKIELPAGARSVQLASDAEGDLAAIWVAATSSGNALFHARLDGLSLTAAPAILGLNPLSTGLGSLQATLRARGVGVVGRPIVFTAAGRTLCTSVTNGQGVATCNALTSLDSLQAVFTASGFTATYKPGEPGSRTATAPLIG